MYLKLYLGVITQLIFMRMYAFDNYPAGAKSSGMGNSSVMLADVWSVQNNQGAMAFYNKFSLGVHHENRFLIPENSYQSAMLAVPLKAGVIGLSYSFFGYKLYNDKKIGLSFSKKLIERLALGIQMDLISSYQFEYGKETRLGAEIGLLAEPVDHLFIGAHVFNPFKSNYKYFDLYDIPTVFKIGAGYRIEEKMLFVFETEKDIENTPYYRGGLEFNALHGLNVRLGFSSNPSRFSFGLGYVYKRILADIAFMSHPDLGFTPHLSISYEFD